MNPDTQVIKRSIAYRAKWRADQEVALPTYRTLGPMTVVPHPKNRNVCSLRTKQLVGTIAKDAFDVSEANNSAVAVQEQPDKCRHYSKEGEPKWENFQSHFEERVAADNDMAKSQLGMVAMAGSLSHGHLNCGIRNILCGAFGCECSPN